MPKVIRKILGFGDSLSDRSTMEKSILAPLSGLEGKSEEGRFTNAYVWFEYALRSLLGHTQVFGDDKFIGTKEVPHLARTYCEGGATAYNYKKVGLKTEAELLLAETHTVETGAIFLEALTDPFEAIALNNLEKLRSDCFRDDQILGVTAEEKEQTLVVGWLGANDLVTINEPTEDAARLAVGACIEHIKAMIVHGYRNFVWFNLPGLELTPRFQNGDQRLRDAAQKSVECFNEELQGEMLILRMEYPGCVFQLFDAHTYFQQTYDNLSQYGFDVRKKTQIYTESAVFKTEGMKAPEDGYLFWDRLHPMRRVHELLGSFFKDLFDRHFVFEFQQEDHIHQFREAYGVRLAQDKANRCLVYSGINHKKETLTLDEIIQHGLFGTARYTGARTLSVMKQLGWINQSKEPQPKYPLLQKFFRSAGEGHVLPTLDEIDEDLVKSRENSFESVKLGT